MITGSQFLQHLRRQSISRDRLNRLIGFTLLGLGNSEELPLRKDRAIKLLAEEFGFQQDEAAERVDFVLAGLQRVRVGPGPITFGE